MSTKNIKWAAQLRDVRDVTVRGLADLKCWTAYLGRYGLTPAERDGNAEIIIIGGVGRFRGVAFRELSFAIVLSAEHCLNGQEAAFLIHSYNSCRFFAFCERVFFSTPYSHADVTLSTSCPASMKVDIGTEGVFEITMGSAESNMKKPMFCGAEDWEEAVYLPFDFDKKASAGKVFFSRVQGDAQKYLFDSPSDKFSIKPTTDTDVLAMLVESQFRPYEWITRQSATHSKSKTYAASRFA